MWKLIIEAPTNIRAGRLAVTLQPSHRGAQGVRAAASSEGHGSMTNAFRRGLSGRAQAVPTTEPTPAPATREGGAAAQEGEGGAAVQEGEGGAGAPSRSLGLFRSAGRAVVSGNCDQAGSAVAPHAITPELVDKAQGGAASTQPRPAGTPRLSLGDDDDDDDDEDEAADEAELKREAAMLQADQEARARLLKERFAATIVQRWARGHVARVAAKYRWARPEGPCPAAGRHPRRLPGHKAWVSCVRTYESKGRPRAISGSRDNTLCLWDLQDGGCIGHLLERSLGHRDFVCSVAVYACRSPTGHEEVPCAVSASRDGRICVWYDLAQLEDHAPKVKYRSWASRRIETTPRLLLDLGEPVHCLSTLSFSAVPTERGRRRPVGGAGARSFIAPYVVGGASDGLLRVWQPHPHAVTRPQTEPMQPQLLIPAHGAALFALTSFTCTPLRHRVVSGARDATMRVWEFTLDPTTYHSSPDGTSNLLLEYSLLYELRGGPARPRAVKGG